MRRIEVKQPLDDFFFDQSYRHLLGSSRDGKHASVVHLDTMQTIAGIVLPSLPHMGSGITFDYQGKRVMATPHLREEKISVIKTIDTKGPGFLMCSHKNSPYAWAGVFLGPIVILCTSSTRKHWRLSKRSDQYPVRRRTCGV